MPPRTYPCLRLISLCLLLLPCLFKAHAQTSPDTIRQFAKLKQPVTLSYPVSDPTPDDRFFWITSLGEQTNITNTPDLFIPNLEPDGGGGYYTLQRSIGGSQFTREGVVLLEPLCQTRGGEGIGCYVCREMVVRYKIPGTRTQRVEPYLLSQTSPDRLIAVDSCRCGDLVLYRLNSFNLGAIDIEMISDNAEGMIDVDSAEFSANFLINPRPVPDSLLVEILADTVPVRQDPNPYFCSDTVVVAIIDSGIERDHSAITDNDIWENDDKDDEADNDLNCLTDDTYGYDFHNKRGDNFTYSVGHGTHLAGIALNDNSGMGPIRLMDPMFYEPGQATLFNAVCAMYYAIDEGAQVMNLSWGFNHDDDVITILTGALDAAAAADVVVVASAGNDTSDNDIRFHWPSNYTDRYDNMITVAAATQIDPSPTYVFASEYSNYSTSGLYVDVSAPGTFIMSTYPIDTFEVKSGTSMAAAYVSHIAALGRSCRPDVKSAALIVDCLLMNLIPDSDPLSPGMVDLEAALACINAIIIPVEEVVPAPELNIYPQPFSSRLFLDLNQLPAWEGLLSLFHASGSLVQRHKILGGREQEVQVNGLPPGIYFYLLRMEGRLFSGKLIRQ